MERYVLCFLLAGIAQQADAAIFKAGEVELVSQTQHVEGDLFLACRSLNMQGTVDGDLLVAAGALNLSGSVRDDLWAAARCVRVGGTVGDDLRVAADSLFVHGLVGGDVLAGCRYFRLGRDATVGGDLTLGCSSGKLLGKVARGALVAAEEVEIAGIVDGDVRVRAAKLVLRPSAQISGRLDYTGPQEAEIVPGAQIRGTANWTRSEEPWGPGKALRGLLGIARIALFFGLLIAGALLVGLLPSWAEEVVRSLVAHPWTSLALGLAFLVCVPVVAVILLISVAGIPLAVFSGMGYVLLVYTGRIFVGLAAGRAVLGRVRTGGPSSPILAVVVGLVVVGLVARLPYVGWILSLVITTAGTGAALLAAHGALSRARPA